MSIVVIEAELREWLSGLIPDWPIRWPNEPWGASVDLSNGNAPTNNDGTPAPYVEVENIIGADTACIAPEGYRQSTRLGLLRVHLAYPQGIGTAPLSSKVDDLWMGFKRKTIQLDESSWQRLTTMDPRIDDNVAVIEDGNRFVRTVSVPWWFNYRS